MSVKTDTNVDGGTGGKQAYGGQRSVLNIIRYSHSYEETRDLGASGTESVGNGTDGNQGIKDNTEENGNQLSIVEKESIMDANQETVVDRRPDNFADAGAQGSVKPSLGTGRDCLTSRKTDSRDLDRKQLWQYTTCLGSDTCDRKGDMDTGETC